MLHSFPLWPETASTIAGRVDHLYYALLAIAAFFGGLIFLTVIIFAVRYRRRFPDDVPKPISGSLKLEIAWTLIPLAITMVIFFWSADLYFTIERPPAGAMEIYVVGKQWMWKFQHPEGNREIDELHIPMGRPIRLTMTSEDVIHSFYVPAFRVKQDVLPGRYTSVWFQATKPGVYHLFCAQYCGAQHASMRGNIIVMEPAAYEAWLSGNTPGESLATQGEKLFNQLGCVGCHLANNTGRCPSLVNLFGRPVQLNTGQQVIADEAYIHESIVRPNAKIVAGYQPVMPTFQGQVTEEGIQRLIAYIKSLAPQPAPSGTPAAAGAPAAATPSKRSNP
jgi:cytochrome c oxidase subunit 2